jgi:glycosyltransferase involved in cell wall biosynthesis
MTSAGEGVPAVTSCWRLLIVVNVPWFFMMHRLPIAIMARSRGVDVHIACGEGAGAEDVVAQGFEFHRVDLTRAAIAPFADARSIGSLVTLYKRLKPDVVHHVTLKPVIYGSIAARIVGIPCVVNAFAGLGYVFTGGTVWARMRRMLLRALMRVALRVPHQTVVFENGDDRRLLIHARVVPPERSMVISGIGVDTDVYRVTGERPGRVQVLFASRMLREKGVVYFVEAARRLLAAGVKAKFVLVGTPDPCNPGSISESQLHKWHAEGCVSWLGFRSDMPSVIADSHVVCLPTYYREGVPRILLEAAACGRPLVATDMPGCRDIVRDRVNGLVVAPHDVEALSRALRELIENRELRVRLGQASREIAAREFALPKVLDQFWGVYSSLLDGV